MLQISQREASWLLIIMICSKIFFTDIMIFVHSSGTAAHLQALWCVSLEWIIFFAIYHFFKKSKENNIFQCVKHAFGKWGLVIFGIVIFSLQILNISAVLKMYSETLSSLTLPTSPIWFLSGLIILSMIVSVYSNFRGLIGVCTAFGVFILSLFALILLLDIPHYDTTNIFPIFGNGIKDILKGVRGVSVFNDIFFLYYLSENLEDKNTVKKTGITVLLATSLITLIATLCYTFAVPYPISTKFYMPIFQISSDITTDVVIQRAEALFLVMWILSFFIYMSAHFYFLTQTFSKAFSSFDSKAIAPVSIVIIISLSSLWQNINQASPFLSITKSISAIVFCFVLFVSFLVSSIKSRKENKNA